MKKEKYKNRYGDIYTFTPTKDGHILWEGDFKWCRYGHPNVYDNAFAAYCENHDNEDITIEVFIQKVHEYDEENECYPLQEYLKLVASNKNVIDMVDPSGGPYIGSGCKSELLHSEIKGKIIERFEAVESGYKIILK